MVRESRVAFVCEIETCVVCEGGVCSVRDICERFRVWGNEKCVMYVSEISSVCV